MSNVINIEDRFPQAKREQDRVDDLLEGLYIAIHYINMMRYAPHLLDPQEISQAVAYLSKVYKQAEKDIR